MSEKKSHFSFFTTTTTTTNNVTRRRRAVPKRRRRRRRNREGRASRDKEIRGDGPSEQIPSFPKHPIKPGESATIDVEFDSAGKQGENTKNVTVWTNCQEPQELLTFYASVQPK